MMWIRRFYRRLGRDERGAELLEMMLVAPLLVIILFGVVEFGNAFHIGQASRERAQTSLPETRPSPTP